jgi:hypothetical protein
VAGGQLEQIDDMNPGIHPYPDGLFWTTQIDDDSVRVNPGDGSAIYRVSNLQIADFGNFDGTFGNGPSTPATVSFEVRWSGVDQRVSIKDPNARFGGEFVRGRAQMAWSAVIGDLEFRSDPIGTSSSDFASLGTERNGSFFPRA